MLITGKMKKKGFLIKKYHKFHINYKKTLSIIQNRILLTLILKAKNYFKGKLLDLGCGEKPYSLIYDEFIEESVGIDVPNSPHSLDPTFIPARAEALPFHENTFDTVLCTEVLEHVDDFLKTLYEIHRVLKHRGKFILSIPFIYPLHEPPNDNLRFTYFGIFHSLEKVGFKILIIKARGGTITLLISLFFILLSQVLTQLGKKLKIKFFNYNFIKWLIYVPQDFYSKAFIFFQKNKFSSVDSKISKYEQFLSLGYFVVAEKEK